MNWGGMNWYEWAFAGFWLAAGSSVFYIGSVAIVGLATETLKEVFK